MKALVIDDEDDVRFIARRCLARDPDITVLEASSGREGVALALSEAPDFIVLDLMMPGFDGEQTLAALQADTATASIPVVLITAKAMRVDAAAIAILGARGVILKPFDPHTLLADVRRIVGL